VLGILDRAVLLGSALLIGCNPPGAHESALLRGAAPQPLRALRLSREFGVLTPENDMKVPVTRWFGIVSKAR
jgi:hypothetical protein